jgi:hypothetical protein
MCQFLHGFELLLCSFVIDYVRVINLVVRFIKLCKPIPQLRQLAEGFITVDTAESLCVSSYCALYISFTELNPVQPLVNVVRILAQNDI